MNLLERIDLALQHVQLSRTDLADAIGVSRQAISNLKRRPGSTLKPEHIAHAARFLHCDLFWLCTGEGGKYVPEDKAFSELVMEVAKLVAAMTDHQQTRICSLVFMASKGHWPELPPEPHAVGSAKRRPAARA